jgi:hypothetical protein
MALRMCFSRVAPPPLVWQVSVQSLEFRDGLSNYGTMRLINNSRRCRLFEWVLRLCWRSWIGRSILYTGDYSMEEDRHLMAAEIPARNPDVLIVESTYGVQVHATRAEREARFTSTIERVVKRGGRCLIPVFALGRAQVRCASCCTYTQTDCFSRNYCSSSMSIGKPIRNSMTYPYGTLASSHPRLFGFTRLTPI